MRGTTLIKIFNNEETVWFLSSISYNTTLSCNWNYKYLDLLAKINFDAVDIKIVLFIVYSI